MARRTARSAAHPGPRGTTPTRASGSSRARRLERRRERARGDDGACPRRAAGCAAVELDIARQVACGRRRIQRRRHEPRDRRAEERRQELLRIGQDDRDEVASAQPGLAERARRRRSDCRADVGIRAPRLGAARHEAVARVGARGIGERFRQRAQLDIRRWAARRPARRPAPPPARPSGSSARR